MRQARKENPPGKARGDIGPRCPICDSPRVHEYRPFCSKRCADVDLGHWLKGSYAIPVTADADEDGDGGDEMPPPASGSDEA